MTKYKYYDFKFELKADENGISVRCPNEGILEFGPTIAYNPPNINTGVHSNAPLGDLKIIGRDVAQLLFSNVIIRNRFIEIWNYGNAKVRLRLCYPNEVDNETRSTTQIVDLMRIPWEYLYLPEEWLTPPPARPMELFLGLRPEISIVHSLILLEEREYPSAQIDHLRVKMKYFSWLGGSDSDNEQKIYQNFVNEYHNLKNLVDYPNLSSPQSTSDIRHGESHDIVTALMTDDLIHLTFHSDANDISLPDGSLMAQELLRASDFMRNIVAKAIILLSCDTAVSDNGYSITRDLNQGGVPIVIGMTKEINFRAAGRFVGGFYNALATWPIDGLEKAIVYGRLGLSNVEVMIEDEGLEGSNWYPGFGMPRLFLRQNLEDSTLISKKLLFDPVIDLYSRFREAVNEFNLDSFNIDNTAKYQERMKAWVNGSIEPPQRQWLLVTGPAGEGKTTQIKLLLKSLGAEQKFCQKQREVDPESRGVTVGDTDPIATQNAEDPARTEEEPGSQETNNTDLKEPPKKVVFHFCDEDHPETSRALEFVRDSLFPQLRCLYGEDYLEAIPDGRYPRLTNNADYALWDFVIRPLECLIKEENKKGKKFERPIIVIDSLDFVPDFQDPVNSIPGLLFRHRDRLENLARFLVSTDYVETNWLNIDGQQPDRPNENSMNIYELTHHTPGDDDIIVISSPKSSKYLFAEMVSRFKDSGLELSSIPQGRAWWDFEELLDIAIANAIDLAAKDKSHSEDWWRRHLFRILNIIAVTAHPLSAPDIAAIAGLYPDGAEKKRLFSILCPFLKEIPGDTVTLNFFHKRLKFYILDRIRYKHDRENLADTHKRFVDALQPVSGGWADLNWETLEGSTWPRQSEGQTEMMARYVQQFLAYHTYHSCYYTSWRMLNIRRERARAYLALICDHGFRNMRFDKARRQTVLQDIWLGLRIIMAEHFHDKSPQKDNSNQTKARVAYDRLLSANQPNSYNRDRLINLEKGLRATPPTANWTDLFSLLGFDSDSERAWWGG